MSTSDNVTAEQALAIEEVRLLKQYYQHREQEDALAASRVQIAARLKEIDGEQRGRRLATEVVAKSKGGA